MKNLTLIVYFYFNFLIFSVSFTKSLIVLLT
uniref:Uncharacterized protein n=1 Tax=Myoviridae sp. ctA4D8 TaxID=2823535 RepID=A0A8S5L6Q0_9CAUD|nr:MAG TPA: hypothetical protein [Myoviridae sp. ctA4D8]